MLSSSGYTSAYGSSSSSYSGSTEQPAGWWALGLMRILTGIIWYTQLLWKAPPHWGGTASTCTNNMSATGLTGLCDWLHRAATHPINADISLHVWSKSFGFTLSTSVFADFVKNTVLAHFTLFAWIIFVVETVVTVSLVFGLLTRLGGILGTIWSLILLFALWSVPAATGGTQFEWYWAYLMLAALNFIMFATRAGRYIGVDGSLVQASGPLGNVFRVLG